MLTRCSGAFHVALPLLPAISLFGHCRRSRRNDKLAGQVEILSAYLWSFGAGGVWPVIVCAAEKPACHAGGRGFEPRLSRHHFNILILRNSFSILAAGVCSEGPPRKLFVPDP